MTSCSGEISQRWGAEVTWIEQGRNEELRESCFKDGAEEGVNGEADWNRQLETSEETVWSWHWNRRQTSERKGMSRWTNNLLIQRTAFYLYCSTRYYLFLQWATLVSDTALSDWLLYCYSQRSNGLKRISQFTSIEKLSLAAGPTLLHEWGRKQSWV